MSEIGINVKRDVFASMTERNLHGSPVVQYGAIT